MASVVPLAGEEATVQCCFGTSWCTKLGNWRARFGNEARTTLLSSLQSCGPSRSDRSKSAEYDGKVAWEAYFAQFEMLAKAQCWDEAERTLQLASALRGQAIEVLKCNGAWLGL